MKKYLFLALAALILAACGGGQKKQVSVRNVEIYGHLHYNHDSEKAEKYFTIEDGTYTFSVSDGKLQVTLPLKTIKELPGKTIDEINDVYVNLLNVNNDEIENEKGEDIEMQVENTDALNALVQSKVGEITKLTFAYTLLSDNDILSEIIGFDICISIDLK